MVLEGLTKRIKGTRYWNKHGKERLYFNTRSYKGRDCEVKLWLEVVNDRLVFQCRVFHRRKHEGEWKIIEERIKHEMTQQYREIIWDCELQRKDIPVDERLKDENITIQSDPTRMPHQEEALRHLCTKKVGALFADVGTGKTKIAIDLAEARFSSKKISKVLVFCPVSTILNFKMEVEKFAKQPDLKWEYVGIESISSSINAFNKAREWIDSETMMIVDESHLVKTPNANRSRHIHAISQLCSYKLIMTGTPIADNVHDLYMQYSMLSDHIIGCASWAEYEKKYVLYGGITGNDIVGYKNLDHLTSLIDPYTYRIRKEDCLKLPKLKMRTHTCGLTDKQEEIYSDTKQQLLDIIDKGDYTSDTIFMFLTKLQQIACGYHYDRSGVFVYLGTKKMVLIRKIGIPSKAIFFCKYLFEVDLLVDELGKEKCAVFTGKNRKDREKEKEDFVKGKKPYFIATSSSGGTGLNGLQTCNTMFRFSQSYKYIEDQQTIGRIERPGQKNDMEVHDISTNAGIDFMIRRCLERKTSLDREVRRLMKEGGDMRAFLEKL